MSFSYIDYKYGPAKNSRNLMDVILPKNNAKQGLVLYIHGGGWITGDKTVDLNSMKNDYVSKGYTYAAINYRFASRKYPKVNCDDIMSDVNLAVSEIKKIALDNGIELTRSFLYGGSAGAHLSMQYSYTMRDISAITPVACCSMSGPTNLLDDYYYECENSDGELNMLGHLISHKLTVKNRNKYEDILEEYSPLYRLNSSSDAVPTLIAHGVKDTAVPYTNAAALDQRLTELGVEHDLLTFPNSNHGLEAPEDGHIYMELLAKILDYIVKYL